MSAESKCKNIVSRLSSKCGVTRNNGVCCDYTTRKNTFSNTIEYTTVYLAEANGSGVTGVLHLSPSLLSEVPEVVISGYILNLPVGIHGFHIHEHGETGNNCEDAGGHFNPTKVSQLRSICIFVEFEAHINFTKIY